ncbi:MAG: VWA domain-containing protein [archaeon]
MDIVFKNPYYLWALVIVPIIVLIHFLSLRYSKKRALKFSNFIAIARVSEKVTLSSNTLILLIRIIAVIAIILAIAGTSFWYQGTVNDSDYVLLIDSSSSMLASDLNPTRLDVAKEAAADFIDKLDYFYSSASIISFSGTPFVHQTLTNDKILLKQAISDIKVRAVGGTDIGSAIVTASNILLSSNRPKVIVLITDGRDNIGIHYKQGIDYANDNNIVVYVIGIGSEESYTIDPAEILSLGIDVAQLSEISDSTDGSFSQIRTAEDFEKAYEDILNDEVRRVSLDLTFILMLLALFLLILEWVLINTRFKIIP